MEEPLYKDDKIEITNHPFVSGGHIVLVDGWLGVASYTLQKGVLSDLAITPRGGIEGKIDSSLALRVKGEDTRIGMDGLHVALCQAYTEQSVRELAERFTIPDLVLPRG